MRLILIVLAAAPLLVALPASAQEGAKPAGAVAVDPRAEALVRRYLAAIDFERTMDAVVGAMLPVITEQTARQNPNLTEAQRQMLTDVVRKVLREKMTPQLIDRFVPIYAETFSIAELEGLVTFYESPIGRSITAKLPSLAPKGAEISRQLMPQMMSEVMREVLERLCPGGKCPAQAPKTNPT